MSDAIGMVETVGLVGVVEAGDAMAKAASASSFWAGIELAPAW